MRLLLDTHALLGWLDGSLAAPAQAAIATPANAVLVSAASVWEVAIKAALGKLEVPGPITDAVVEEGFEPLPITFRHAAAVGDLPPHHRDPFDRVLVAQAVVEGCTLVTRDPAFAPYGVPLLGC